MKVLSQQTSQSQAHQCTRRRLFDASHLRLTVSRAARGGAKAEGRRRPSALGASPRASPSKGRTFFGRPPSRSVLEGAAGGCQTTTATAPTRFSHLRRQRSHSTSSHFSN